MGVPHVRSQQAGASVSSRDLQQAGRYTQSAFEELFRTVPLLNGSLLDSEPDTAGRPLDGIEFTAGVQRRVPHKRPQVPRGWWVVRDFGLNANQLREVSRDGTALTLVSAVDCQVYLWAWG